MSPADPPDPRSAAESGAPLPADGPPPEGPARGGQPREDPTSASALPPLRDDGLPTLPSGEPVLARWFVLVMLLLVPVGIAVGVWAVLSIPRDPLPAAERRPPGDAEVTIDRGRAELGATRDVEWGPACGQSIELVGDGSGRATVRRALDAACTQLRTGRFPEAQDGLRAWTVSGGRMRVAVFELSGVDASARVEDGAIVLELNAKFQFEDAVRAAPAVIHQLTLIGDPTWPGLPITAERELLGTQAQALACEQLRFRDDPPRGCLDVAELLADPNPLAALTAAGFPRAPAGEPSAAPGSGAG